MHFAAAEIFWLEKKADTNPTPTSILNGFSFGLCTVVWRLWITGGSLPLPNKLPR